MNIISIVIKMLKLIKISNNYCTYLNQIYNNLNPKNIFTIFFKKISHSQDYSKINYFMLQR